MANKNICICTKNIFKFVQVSLYSSEKPIVLSSRPPITKDKQETLKINNQNLTAHSVKPVPEKLHKPSSTPIEDEDEIGITSQSKRPKYRSRNAHDSLKGLKLFDDFSISGVALPSAQNLKTFMEQQSTKENISTYFVGTKYELEVIETLKRLQFSVERTGQALDKGVDFRGKWILSNDFHVPIIGQCKKESKKSGASHLREFEGTLSHQPTISGKETIGIFVNTSGYSPEAYKHANQSTFPLILTVIEANSQSFPRALTHFVANPRAVELVPNLVIGHRYHQMQHDKKIVVLFFDGKELGGSEK